MAANVLVVDSSIPPPSNLIACTPKSQTASDTSHDRLKTAWTPAPGVRLFLAVKERGCASEASRSITSQSGFGKATRDSAGGLLRLVFDTAALPG